MFSGIIKTAACVADVRKNQSRQGVVGACSMDLSVDSRSLQGVELGSSCAVNGVCLTVSCFLKEQSQLSFDLSTQTLARSTLADIAVGDEVHFERSLRVGEEQGGHFLSGHIEGVGRLVERKPGDVGDVFCTFEVGEACRHYLFDRGFIGVHGVSLTPHACCRSSGRFTVNLIAETLKRTCFAQLSIGGEVNVEVDHHTKVLVEVMRGWRGDDTTPEKS